MPLILHQYKRSIEFLITALWFVIFNLVDASYLYSSDGERASTSDRPMFALVGDSTVTDHAGWGQGFQSLLRPNVACSNFAQSGRSSRSFRAEGFWEKCIAAKPKYLLIQFGHNDQAGKGPKRESSASGDFRTHLRQYVEEAKEKDIKPILITPLTRRRWTSDGRIEGTLSEYAEATRFVSQTLGTPLIDLHQRSVEQCEKMGPTAYRAFEPMTSRGADHTHLNREGSLAVATLVARDLVTLLPELSQYFDNDKIDQAKYPRELPQRVNTRKLRLDNTKTGITVSSQGKTILRYNKVSPSAPSGIDQIYERSGFLHPVMTPKGKVITEAFPFDHPHQQGIFSAWVSTTWNGHPVDFWNLAKGTGCVLHQSVHAISTKGHDVEFAVDLIHRMKKPVVVDILKERWTIRIREETDGIYLIDLHSKQSSLTEHPLLIKKFHYGGFAVRGPVEWLSPKQKATGENIRTTSRCQIANEHTTDRLVGNHQRSRWVTMSGLVDQLPASITMMHANAEMNERNTARLHPSKPYFCYAPCVERELKITFDQPFESHYRFLVADSIPQPNWIEDQWEKWQVELSSSVKDSLE